MRLKFYEIDADYIEYLLPYASHLFHNSKTSQANTRKYIGIVLKVNGFDYFAPLTSFKPKHEKMKDGLDFIKIKRYAVLNLNNMFPAPIEVCNYIDFSEVRNASYRNLLMAEYREIKRLSDRIVKNASNLYRHKINNNNEDALSKRCNDFLVLEEACTNYES